MKEFLIFYLTGIIVGLLPAKCFATECSAINPVICKGGYLFYLYNCTSNPDEFKLQINYRPVVNKDGSLAVCKKD